MAIFCQSKQKNRSLLFSHEFKIINNKSNEIPILHLDMPKGYSLFCDEWEYKEIFNYVAQNDIEKMNEKQKTESIKEEPEPKGRHNRCQICNIKFDNYLKHIKSKIHLFNVEKNKQTICNIKNIFKRIVENNKNEKLIKNTSNVIYSCIYGKNKIIPDKEIFNKNLKTILNSDVTTKEDSFSQESNNNIIKVNNLSKIDEDIEKKEENEDKNNDDLDEIRKLLEIFSETDKKNKKRKKNEVIRNYEENNDKDNFFGVDPCIKLREVTRMIAQCNLENNERENKKSNESDNL